MYSCPLHNWNSHDFPCPSCHVTVTTESAALVPERELSSMSANKVIELYEEQEREVAGKEDILNSAIHSALVAHGILEKDRESIIDSIFRALKTTAPQRQ